MRTRFHTLCVWHFGHFIERVWTGRADPWRDTTTQFVPEGMNMSTTWPFLPCFHCVWRSRDTYWAESGTAAHRERPFLLFFFINISAKSWAASLAWTHPASLLSLTEGVKAEREAESCRFALLNRSLLNNEALKCWSYSSKDSVCGWKCWPLTCVALRSLHRLERQTLECFERIHKRRMNPSGLSSEQMAAADQDVEEVRLFFIMTVIHTGDLCGTHSDSVISVRRGGWWLGS